MPVHDDLGKRMKEYYEQVPKTRLVRRMPVAIRIDGKAFHTFTKGFDKPFDDVLIKTMQETTKYLCENIQGCVLGYTQSDEITLILVDYKTLDTSAWFDYEVQKMCSVSASMATMAFNKIFAENCQEWFNNVPIEDLENKESYVDRLFNAYSAAFEKGAMFDARVFNIPKEEVTNLIYWRQLDATRNSIQMVGQSCFSHKELQGKSCNMIQDMLHEQKGINWNNFQCHKRRGTCVIRQDMIKLIDGMLTTRNEWYIDKCIPIFKGEDRKYIDKLVFI
jgi:tRNA(His) 5'-end guanylyltransferase